MSEEEDESRKADIRIVKAPDGTYYRVDVKFLGYITAAVRWDDREPEARSEIMALLRDAPTVIKDAFMEIDVERGAENIDVEWESYSQPLKPNDPQPHKEEDDQ